jgi:hypothetical protein
VERGGGSAQGATGKSKSVVIFDGSSSRSNRFDSLFVFFFSFPLLT